MVKKKSVILAILVIFLFTLTAVSAGENVTDDAIAENAHEDVEINVTKTAGTFQDLHDLIEDTSEGHLLELDRDYENEGRWNFIEIDKEMGIDGKGHSIDAKSVSRVFRITGSNVLLKNITFLNGNYDDFYGGAIYLNSTSSLRIIGCKFINFSAESGGAIYCDEFSGLRVVNSSFINCSAKFGGAIYFRPNTVSVINNTNFTNNVAEVIGGSLFSTGCWMTIERSSFKNSSAIYESGGAFTFLNTVFEGHYLTISDCGSEFGGAFTLLSSKSNITHSKFRKNSALYDGGALYAAYGELYLEDNEFIDNSANRGGAAFISLITTEISNNLLKDNSATLANAVYALTVNCSGNMSADNYGSQQSDFIKTVNNNLTITGSDYYQFRYRPVNITVLPEYYSMVDEKLLTPVKDQGTEGNCWAFAAMAALESCILKASGCSLDLSEANLKNLMALYSNYGYIVDVNDGGHDEMVYGYLASWLGPIFEIDDTYYINDYLSPLLKSILHIQNIVIFNRTDYLDNDAIKNAIIQYGAVATGMYYGDDYINENSYYYDGNETGNHAVCIVGWDDSYSKNNFKITPQGDGAWIVRNSWGPSWGDRGYFYVSYYDTAFAQVNTSRSYTFILNDTVRLDRVYQFEIQKISYIYFPNYNHVRYKNVFVVEGNEYLAATSTIFVEECDYRLEIIVNGDSKINKTGRAMQGYYTVNLDDFIYLNRNDTVEVVFDCTNFKDGTGKFPVSAVSSCTDLYIQPGISYYLNGGRWLDLYSDDAVACIKMFTTFTNDHKLNPYLELALDIDTADGGYIIEVIHSADVLGNVSITYNQEVYVINLSNENSIKLFNLIDGEIISARYWGDEIYCNKTVTLKVDTNISTVGTFEDLLDKIAVMGDGEVLNLTKNYASDVSGDEIIIKKAITIDGHGHSIDANHLSRIFNIRSDNVVLKNINFIGGYHTESGSVLVIDGFNCSVVNCNFTESISENGATIHWIGANARISNSTFTKNSGRYGGAIYLNASECEISNCRFTGNYAEDGGAILLSMSKTEIVNCSFTGNGASDGGGAVFCDNSTVKFRGCSFKDNNALDAGAIFSSESEQEIVGCNFTGNSATGFAGAVYLMSEKCIIENCRFDDNRANTAGAIYCNCNEGKLINSIFVDNPDAVFWAGSNGKLINSTFINNINSTQIIWNGQSGTISGCKFLKTTRNNVENRGAVFTRRNADPQANDEEFTFNNPHVITVALNGVVYDLPITSDFIFEFTKASDLKTYRINSTSIYNELFDLDVGEWSVKVIFEGDDNYNTFESHFTLKVNPEVSFIKINDTDAFRGHETQISAGVFDADGHRIDGGTVRFYNGDEFIGSADVTSGVAKIGYVPKTGGKYSINAFYESNNYMKSNATATLTVESPSIAISIEDGTVGFTSTFKANVTQLYSTVNTGTVAFYIQGQRVGEVSVSSGFASIGYVPLTAGNYRVMAVYSIYSNFTDAEDSASYGVQKADSAVGLSDFRGTFGNDLVLTAFITSSNGLSISEGTVTFRDGNNIIGSANVKNGAANVTYIPKKVGTYQITASFEASNYNSSSNASQVSIGKANTQMTFDAIESVYYKSSTGFALTVSSNGKPVGEGSVGFYVNNQQIYYSAVQNGRITFDYTFANAGTYEITAMFGETANYNPSNQKATFTVMKLPTAIVSSDITAVYNTGGEVTVTLKDNKGNSLGDFAISIDSKPYTTDSNGQVKISIKGWNPNSYVLAVAFDGSTNYDRSTSSVKVTVLKATPKLSASKKTFKRKVKTKKYTVTLKTNLNTPLAKMKVSIKINGKTFKATTAASGKATFKIKKLTKKGTYKSTVTFAGNAQYNKISKKVKITVK